MSFRINTETERDRRNVVVLVIGAYWLGVVACWVGVWLS